MTFSLNGHDYVIDSQDGKNFTIKRGDEPERMFTNWAGLKAHMQSFLSCRAASVEDVVRYSRVLMQCQASRCGQLG